MWYQMCYWSQRCVFSSFWSRKGHATKGHLIVYNLLYLPPIKGKTVLYLKIISHKGTISGGWSYKYKIRSLRILSGLLYVQGAL
jgi:hypothetical protein